MPKTFIGVRDVDEETFRKFKAKALMQKIKIGEAITRAMHQQLEKERISLKENLARVKDLEKIKPLRIAGTERTSEQIDEILYGIKK